jgi:DNA-directed RNA polymerase specialized sigma24 family protein
LAKRLPTFAYDPAMRFRKYLKTITNNMLNDFFRDLLQRPKPPTGDSQVLDLMSQVEARTDLQRQIELTELISAAEERVRAMLKGHSWEIYCLLLKENWSPTEVANQFNMQVSAVNMAKCRVLGRLRVELRRLDTSLDSDEGAT